MGSGFRTFQSGEVLTASNVQNYLMEQSVMVFAGTAALDSAIGTAVEAGMVAYLTDSDQLIHYVADAAQGTAWQALPMNGAPRNVIINGAMQVHQRGTSVASITTGGYYTADRWNLAITSIGTWTQSSENDAPTGSGFRKSLKLLCTTADATPAAGDLFLFRQFIEGQNLQQFLKGTASAKQFAMSFWVKSNVTGTYIVELRDADNTRAVSASYTISASGTWEKKTVIFPADTTGAFDNDNARSLDVHWGLGAGTDWTSGTLQTTWSSITNTNRYVGQTNVAAATNNYWQITGVQLEAGSVATPFEFEDYGVTLAKCQRYYLRPQSRDAYSTQAVGMARSTTQADFVLTLPVTMRARPTSLEWATQNVASPGVLGTAVTAITIDNASSDSYVALLASVASGLTQYRPYVLSNNNDATGYIAVSAEL